MNTPINHLQSKKDAVLAYQAAQSKKSQTPQTSATPVQLNLESPTTRIKPTASESIEEILTQPHHAPVSTGDISEKVLDGRLGEIYERRLAKFFPRSYAYTSLLTIAGAMVPKYQEKFVGVEKGQTNLYTALVGPINTGKSQASEWSRHILGISPERFSQVKAGSAEGLLKKLSKDGISGQYIIDLDEWSRFFVKAGIEGSALPTLLTSGFYNPHQQVTMAGGSTVDISVYLSWLGGIVEDEFEQCFSNVTNGGVHDRFMFGQCPTGYAFDYRPYEGESEEINFKPVRIDGSVWEVASEWRKQYPTAGRAIEIAIRVANICASADGRPVLYGSALNPAKVLMLNQLDIRKILRPNLGNNPNAQTESTILHWMERHADDGRWVNLRDLKRSLNFTRTKVGNFVWGRAITTLAAGEDIEIIKEDASGGAGHAGGRSKTAIRLVRHF